MSLVNGIPSDSLPVEDRGLAYGDGVFRTLRLQGGQPVWWRDHYATLARDAAALNLPCPEAAILLEEISLLAAGRDGVVKLVLTRGGGPRGYASPADPQITRIVIFSPPPENAPGQRVEDITARWCTLRLGRQPRLAGIKHLNRLENVLARAEWHDPAVHEGLLCDDTGAVISGVMGNLFIVSQGALTTPDLAQCGVAGVARTRILRAASERRMTVRVTRIEPQDVQSADAVMLCNSVQGVRRVARLETQTWPSSGWADTLNTWLYEVD